ncbi:MAG: hypothetical protein JRD05_00750 [Deltaproteobacteria bacterium]|nr:hypothetical protein [Deltaproteobacteria bacterium]
MIPCRGIHEISCTRKSGCLRNLKAKNVQPECMSCPDALTQILDLEGKVIYEHKIGKKVSRKGAKAQLPEEKVEGKKQEK